MPDELTPEAEEALALGELPEGELQVQERSSDDVVVNEQPPTVHIVVNRPDDGAGQVTVDVVGTGDIRVTEIETVIKLGLAKWQQQAGLG